MFLGFVVVVGFFDRVVALVFVGVLRVEFADVFAGLFAAFFDCDAVDYAFMVPFVRCFAVIIPLASSYAKLPAIKR